jgi:hypothetical protein
MPSRAVDSPAATAIDARRRWLLRALVAGAMPLPGATATDARQFRVFDALLHRGKPDLRSRGLTPVASVAQIWRPGESRSVVDEGAVVLALEQVPRGCGMIFLDIEDWPLFQVSSAERAANIGNLILVAELVRRELPRVQFGFYGFPPINAYWPIIRRDASYQAWLETNRALAPVARMVDCLFPSLYTFYSDRSGWLDFANAQLDEARRYDKPVYPFLWFQYFDGNLLLRGREVATEAWEEELRLCRARADGLVLWGGWEQHWSESADWWRTTQRVLDLAT